MDKIDREKYAAVYRLLAEILERDRAAAEEEGHVPYILGDLARRVFVGSQFDPPDEVLEMVARLIRTGDEAGLKSMAKRLREHATYLQTWEDRQAGGES